MTAACAFLATYGFLIVSMALAALLALSLYIPFLAGQLSLASPGFYALGGYIAAVLATRVLPSASGSSSIPSLLLEMALAGAGGGAPGRRRGRCPRSASGASTSRLPPSRSSRSSGCCR